MSAVLSKIFVFIAGVAGCAGIALGALSAHALQNRLDAAALATLHTVSIYLIVHGVLLAVVGAWCRILPEAIVLRVTGALLVTGIFLFCGGLSIAKLAGIPAFTAVAPAGGMALMAGWLSLAVFALWKL